uniref:Transcription factor CBF/NF-Y/archaeal histone domain-containing protein n=1 Tax=Glossina pallidipes TaxID=7398 RepID=A0A1B0A995_GLOPL
METELPHTRIRTIMKSSLDTGQITNEVLYLMTKSTEMFIKHFTKEAYSNVKKTTNILKYEHLANLVQNNENLEFLLQIVPQKITVKNLQGLLKQDESSESSSEEDN